MAPPLVVPDVPYLAQTEALCGGAALAMVLRYWGHATARPEDFASLVDSAGTGIPTDVLTASARDSGRAFAFRGRSAEVAAHLGKGRPVIALLEVAPRRYHYVVLLAWRDQRVLLHDPASGPFQVMAEAAWLDAWQGAGDWALLVLPDPPRSEAGSRTEALASAAASAVPTSAPDGCADWVEVAIAKARAGRVTAAREQLGAAASWCPRSSGPLRELAALEFQAEAWDAAAALAARAVALEPADAHAWRLLATSRFLGGHTAAALVAWNQVSEPRFDTLHTSGFDRMPVRTLASYLAIEGDAVLTAAALRQARRRAQALPALRSVRVGYRPVGGGRAQVEAAAVERGAVSGWRTVLLDSAVRAARERALGVEVHAVTRRGEALRAFGRWRPERQRAVLTATAPRALGLPGLITVEALWDEESYAASLGPERERRKRASLAVDDWWTADLRGRATVGLDEWSGRGRRASLAVEAERRLGSDRLALAATGAGWWSPAASPFFVASAQLRARASTGDGPNALAEVSYDLASAGAPRGLWQGAGAEEARDRRLRGHALLQGGVIAGPAFGRELVSSSVEVETRLASIGPLALRGGLFADAARALAPARSPLLIDVGVGLSLRPPTSRSSLRVDVATPWGRVRPRLSVGWRLAWSTRVDRS